MGGISLSSEYADTAIKAIDEKSEELRSISLQIHDNPELGEEEEFAHNLLVTFLEDQAFVAEFSSKGGKGRVVSFNSEYDALPEIGHACGHNLIAISGVAGALALKAVFEKHEIPGKVKLFGTPAEG
ncbi:hypothetical protein RclHR1_03340018 [Rhizophagus clarus]|uniref:Peptidase M20 dimerisation domain-containing protein n=1 Tax=Rhizophagus clarus TaxID=94130 RepID=A0A2Z6R918_9GLOM|nr:hypothetical protein RclHR1_03340018 [Rhizophagus clarus]